MLNFTDQQQKIVAAVLYQQYRCPQHVLGRVFGNRSQSTISNWIKEGMYLMQIAEMQASIKELHKECEFLANQIKSIGYDPNF